MQATLISSPPCFATTKATSFNGNPLLLVPCQTSLFQRRQSRSLCISADSDRSASVTVESPPTSSSVTQKLNKYSSRITEPKSQGGSQAILYGVGLSDDDMHKPQVGISSVWYEGNTCNMHLLQLAEAVKEGVREAGMVGFRFNTIGVSDAISMGTRGMCFSLQSRDLIADSIETVMAAQWYDANISIPGCDKNVTFLFSLKLLFFIFVQFLPFL